MKLGGCAIIDAFESGQWKAFAGYLDLPFNKIKENVNPNSIDVCLSPSYIDANGMQATEIAKFILEPNQMILGCTFERFDTDAPLNINGQPVYFVQQLNGKSSWGRKGLLIHVTAGFGDYGFKGAWTLEMMNIGKKRLEIPIGARIAQICFDSVYRPFLYKGKYSGSDHYTGPVKAKK